MGRCVSRTARPGIVAAAAVLAAAAALLGTGRADAHAGYGPRLTVAEVDAELAAADREQGVHEFRAAVRRLDRVIAAEPRHVGALLMRATIEVVLGEFAAARRDCSAVVKAGATLPGTVCLASAATGAGSLARSRALLAALPAGGENTGIEAWRLVTEADLALRDGDVAAAVGFLTRAQAADPADEEIRTRLAERLLEAGELAGAMAMARAPEPSLARRIVLARAARAAGDADALEYRRQAEEAIRASRGDHALPHLREEALAALHLADDPARALDHARRNFELQKDTADLRTWVEAARAAGSATDLRAAADWLAATGFQDRLTESMVPGRTYRTYSAGQ